MFLELKKQLKSNYILVFTILILLLLIGIFIYLIIKYYNLEKDNFVDISTPTSISLLQTIPDNLNFISRSKYTGYDIKTHDSYDLQYNFRPIAVNNEYIYISYNPLNKSNSSYILAGSASGTNNYFRRKIDTKGNIDLNLYNVTLKTVLRDITIGYGGSALTLFLNKNTIICIDSYRYGRYIKTGDFDLGNQTLLDTTSNNNLIQTAFSPAIDMLSCIATQNTAFFIPWATSDLNIYYVNLEPIAGQPTTTSYSSYNYGSSTNNSKIKQIKTYPTALNQFMVVTYDNKLYSGFLSPGNTPPFTFKQITLPANISCKTVVMYDKEFACCLGYNNNNTTQNDAYFILPANMSYTVNKFSIENNVTENFIDIAVSPYDPNNTSKPNYFFALTENKVYYTSFSSTYQVDNTLKLLVTNPTITTTTPDKFYQIYVNNNAIYVLYESGRIAVANIVELIKSLPSPTTSTIPILISNSTTSTNPTLSTSTIIPKNSEPSIVSSNTNSTTNTTSSTMAASTTTTTTTISQLPKLETGKTTDNCRGQILIGGVDECNKYDNCYYNSYNKTCYDKSKDNFSISNYANLDQYCKYNKTSDVFKISCNLNKYDSSVTAPFDDKNTFINKISTDSGYEIFNYKNNNNKNLLIYNGYLQDIVQDIKTNPTKFDKTNEIIMEDVKGALTTFKLSDINAPITPITPIDNNTPQVITYNSSILSPINDIIANTDNNISVINDKIL